MKVIIIVSSFLAFFVKISLHIYLDIKNKRFDGLKPFNMLPFLYFFPYSEKVKTTYQFKKKVCNLSYLLFILLTIYSLIFF